MPEVIVLDTHIWFWFITQEFERFPNEWREAIETAGQVGVSVISCYEIALAQQRGRLELPCAVNQWFQRMFEKSSNVCLTTLAIEKLNEIIRVLGLVIASLSCILGSS